MPARLMNIIKLVDTNNSVCSFRCMKKSLSQFCWAAFWPVLVIGMLLLAGCGSGGPATVDREVLRVVVTTGMIADVVREVAGERAEVVQLMGEGIDPHGYTPTRDDVAALLAADVVFFNGLLLEGKMEGAFEKVKNRGIGVHAVTGLISESMFMVDGEENERDPHVWMDVALWSEAVEAVLRVLTESAPEHAAEFAARAAAYQWQLEALQTYAREVIGTIPEEQRVLVTAHDAFQYFGRAYGIEVRGIQGLSTESEAGVRDINELVDFIVARRIGAIFVESSVTDRNVRAVIEGAMSRGHELVVGGELFSDAMGPKGTYEGTYIGMIDHNVTSVARALGGVAPAGGMQGRLEIMQSE